MILVGHYYGTAEYMTNTLSDYLYLVSTVPQVSISQSSVSIESSNPGHITAEVRKAADLFSYQTKCGS